MAKKNTYYKIMTLNAATVLAGAEWLDEEGRYDFDFDLGDVIVRERLVSKIERYADSAMFHQLRLAMGKTKDDEPQERELIDHLVYMDFNDVFADRITYANPLRNIAANVSEEELEQEIERRSSDLMENGLKLKMRGAKEEVVFWPFDKSASMSRKSVITFLSDEYFEDMDERVRLGIDFSDIKLYSSKYYAYRGLYLTNGRRIEKIKLDWKKVIVVDDAYSSAISNVVTCSDRPDKNKRLSLTDRGGKLKLIDGEKLDINCFDGEGIVSGKYASLINNEFFKDRDGRASSFQIRMPYVKGMLHKVDFKAFIKEHLELETFELDGIMVKDTFNIPREIAKAEIILTRSMFKAASWLETVADRLGEPDPMQLYFRQFKKYDNALYVIGTSRSYTNIDRVKLNYQFINTLDLEDDELHELSERHYSEARDLPRNAKSAGEALIKNFEKYDTDEDDMPDDDTYADDALDLLSWQYALLRNPSFVSEPLIKKKLEDMSRSMKNKGILGRFWVSGTMAYLSGDLLSLMIHILKNIEEGVDEETLSEAINDLEGQRLDAEDAELDRFYLPGYDCFEFDENKYYAVLRSPHLSRNEQCAMRPFYPDEESVYEKYFKDLTGVIMLPYNSPVPEALAGADFDGDLVKIFADEIINKAIIRGAYKETETVEGTKVYERKLPIAYIPKPKSKPTIGPEKLGFKHLELAFSNKVGHISNTALKVADLEYINNDENGVYDNMCALCTIATGLELDAVKTGARPYLQPIDELVEDYEDEFLKMKYQIDKGLFKSGQVKVINQKIRKKDYYVAKKNNDIVTRMEVNPDKEHLRPVDMLRYYYLEELYNNKQSDGAPELDDKKLFKVEIGYKGLDKTDKAYATELKKIWGAYLKYNRQYGELQEKLNNLDRDEFIRKIKHLLYTEYDITVDRVLPLSGVSLEKAISETVRKCEEQLDTQEKVDEASVKLKQHWKEWIFANDHEARKVVLRGVLDFEKLQEESEAPVELLCDAYENGYHILKFVLEHIRTTRNVAHEEANLLKQYGEPSDSKNIDNTLVGQLWDAFDNRDTAETRGKAVREICRKRITELFGGDMKKAAKIALQGSDKINKGRDMFWNWFDAEEVLPLVR